MMRKNKTTFLFLVCCLLILSGVWAGFGNKFVFAQLKYDGAWDPYPHVSEPVFEMIKKMTNIPFYPERKILTLQMRELFEYPFLVIKGNSAFKFTDKEQRTLKRFIDRGGMVFFDDTLAEPDGDFAQSVKSLMKDIYPGTSFQPLSQDHALFRSFFLLRNVGGRRIAKRYLMGLDIGGQGGGEGRTAVIYCPNDLFGAWVKDPMGNYLFSCEPGGESQRWESFKLTLNLIYFSLTGTYKRDAVHQPFIERKLGR